MRFKKIVLSSFLMFLSLMLVSCGIMTDYIKDTIEDNERDDGGDYNEIPDLPEEIIEITVWFYIDGLPVKKIDVDSSHVLIEEDFPKLGDELINEKIDFVGWFTKEDDFNREKQIKTGDILKSDTELFLRREVNMENTLNPIIINNPKPIVKLEVTLYNKTLGFLGKKDVMVRNIDATIFKEDNNNYYAVFSDLSLKKEGRKYWDFKIKTNSVNIDGKEDKILTSSEHGLVVVSFQKGSEEYSVPNTSKVVGNHDFVLMLQNGGISQRIGGFGLILNPNHKGERISYNIFYNSTGKPEILEFNHPAYNLDGKLIGITTINGLITLSGIL